MRGEILTYDTTSETGSISGDDSLRYSFSRSDIQGSGQIAVGGRVDFIPQGEQATQIVVLAAIAATPYGQAGDAPLPAEKPYDFKAMFDFNGRMRRQHFWISWLILLGVSVVLGWIPLLGLVISLGLIWPNLAIQVQRLHDMGKTGWFVLIPVAGGIIGMIMMISAVGLAVFTNPEALESEDPAVVLSMLGSMMGGLGVMFLVTVGFLLWIGITDSQPGDNRFGPNPKGQ